jgi:hypothetical protein
LTGLTKHKLDTFKLTKCEITKLEPLTAVQFEIHFCNVDELDLAQIETQTLIIQNCNLNKVPKVSEVYLVGPKFLDVSYNQISTLNNVSRTVKTLVCNFNQIKSTKNLAK